MAGPQEINATRDGTDRVVLVRRVFAQMFSREVRRRLTKWHGDRELDPVWPWALFDDEQIQEADAVWYWAWQVFSREAVDPIFESGVLPDAATYRALVGLKEAVLTVLRAVARRRARDLRNDPNYSEPACDQSGRPAVLVERLAALHQDDSWKRWQRIRDAVRQVGRGRRRYATPEYKAQRRASQATDRAKVTRRAKAALLNAQKRVRYWKQKLSTAKTEAELLRAGAGLATAESGVAEAGDG